MRDVERARRRVERVEMDEELRRDGVVEDLVRLPLLFGQGVQVTLMKE